jgi:hypothetical protein
MRRTFLTWSHRETHPSWSGGATFPGQHQAALQQLQHMSSQACKGPDLPSGASANTSDESPQHPPPPES